MDCRGLPAMNDTPIDTAALLRMYEDRVIAGDVASLENTAGNTISDCMSIGCPLLLSVQIFTVATADKTLLLWVSPPIWH